MSESVCLGEEKAQLSLGLSVWEWVRKREKRGESHVCECVCARLSPCALLCRCSSLSARPAPKLRLFSTQKQPPYTHTNPSLFTPSPPLLLNHQNGLLQAAAQEGLLMVFPPSIYTTSLPNTEDTPVLKVCHNNGLREGIILASATFNTTAHWPTADLHCYGCNSQRVPTRVLCAQNAKLPLSE